MTSEAAAAPGRRSDLGTRAATGVAMTALAVAALWVGGVAFWLLASAAALLMVTEWAALMRARRLQVTLSVLVLAVVLVGSRWQATYPLWTFYPGGLFAQYLLAVGGALVLSLLTLRPALGAGILYAGLPAMSLIYLRGQHTGFALALWTLAVVWATDIGAYFAGRAIGGPKLAPRISPNKTWAGLIGGIAAALAVGAAIAARVPLSPWLMLLGAPMAVLAQAGDLYESWLKRRCGVKDSGRLLPGHGGALDRLDGLVPVAVAVALLATIGWI